MHKRKIKFPSRSVDFYFQGHLSKLKELADPRRCILLTDEHVYEAHAKRMKGFHCIVLKAGEAYKVQQTVDAVIDELIDFGADRHTLLIGVGGGVITDLTGYIASIYMRGMPCAFVPTTILCMVDAAIGGKNGVDVGLLKNMVGCFKQPEWILYDYALLKTLPEAEWVSGFAEIIKHAAIQDATLFRALEHHNLSHYRKHPQHLHALIERNVRIKANIVRQDETETGARKLLNFGHTLGHALENAYELSHGQAIAIGMTYAGHLSARLQGFKSVDRLVSLLSQYGLPTYAHFDLEKVLERMTSDKKRSANTLHYILLKRIGKAVIQPIPVQELANLFQGS
jgi:3-dehydroquinate synthase